MERQRLTVQTSLTAAEVAVSTMMMMMTTEAAG